MRARSRPSCARTGCEASATAKAADVQKARRFMKGDISAVRGKIQAFVAQIRVAVGKLEREWCKLHPGSEF